MKKKAIDQKKRLLKAQVVLKKAYEKIIHFCSKCIAHIFEKTKLKEKLKKLSKKISQESWDIAIRVAQV